MSGAHARTFADLEPAPAPGPGLRVLAAAVLVAGVVAAAWPLVHDLGSRPVRSVRIAGDFMHVSRTALEKAVAPHIDARFVAVDVDEVRRAVESLPWVRQVSVRRVWPDSLHVAVVERTAVARWNGTNLLEADATVFTPSAGDRDRNLPALAGPPGTAAEVLARFERFEHLATAVDEQVASVSLSPRGAWRVDLAGGLRLVLGRSPDMDALERRVRALPRLFGERLARVQRIDMRYAKGFAVRWRGSERDTGEGAS